MTNGPGTHSIRFADGDADVISIFRFLCFVSAPVLLAPIDAQDAVTEVNRIVHGQATGEGFAVIAEINGEIVGTLGVVKVPWWYNVKSDFLTDRFFFTYPALANSGIGAGLQAEAAAIAAQLGLDLIINGKFVRRNRRAGRGVVYTSPTVIRPSSH